MTSVITKLRSNVYRRSNLEINDIDILWLELRLRLKRILIGNTYRPPNDLNFFSHFNTITSRVCSATNKSVLLIGDFNCNTLAPNSQPTKLLLTTTNELQLEQLVSSPTRTTANSRTTIDLIFSSDLHTASTATVTPCSLSDHHIISCRINIKPTRRPQRFVHSRPLHKCDTVALNEDLQAAPWHVPETFDTIEDQVNFWESLYLDALNRHAPTRRYRVRVKSLPWIDCDLRSLMRHRDWLHKKAIKDSEENSQTVWDAYKSVRNKVTSELRRAKTNYYHNLCSSNIHPSELWKRLHKLLSKTKSQGPKSVTVNGNEVTNKTEIAEAMNFYFTHSAPPTILPPQSSCK